MERLTEGFTLPGVPREKVLPLTWTGVIRPDECVDERIAEFRKHPHFDSGLHLAPLKAHAGHLPDRPSAVTRYSRRTRERIRLAEKVFEVVESPLMPKHTMAASWQESLRLLRGIPRNSSPDRDHFESLAALPAELLGQTLVIELRSRSESGLCGILLALKEQPPGQSLHAHSFLSLPEARECFGNYLMLHSLITRHAHCPIWLGGKPAGNNGDGVWRFKSRFANAFCSAWVLSIDLQAEALARLRSRVSLHSWLPNYRDPHQEMRK